MTDGPREPETYPDEVTAEELESARARLLTFLYAPKLGDLANLYLGAAPHPFAGSSLLWRASSQLLRAMDDPTWPEKLGHAGLTWREIEGPAVTEPERRGFGSRLIERSVRHDLGGEVELDYATTGFSAEISFPLSRD